MLLSVLPSMKIDVDLRPTDRGFLCVAVAWILLVCYSVLLVSAVESLVDLLDFMSTDSYAKQVVIFLYGLAVVSFLGGSQIPAVFLRKKSFIVQFGFSAAFGFMLLLLTILGETNLEPLKNTVFRPFFSSYPVIALEYLSIPYLFMIFIDLYLSGRLSAFSVKRFIRFLSGTFLHPRSTFQEVIHKRSTLFSTVSVMLVCVAWIVRAVAVSSSTGFVPARWYFVPLSIGESLGIDILFKTAVITPAMLLVWLIASVLVYLVARLLGGAGSYSKVVSLLGFAFLPSLITVAVDFLEIAVYPIKDSFVLSAIFLVLGFAIPLVLWPLILATLAVQTSESLAWKRAALTVCTVFLPLFILLILVFL